MNYKARFIWLLSNYIPTRNKIIGLHFLIFMNLWHNLIYKYWICANLKKINDKKGGG